MIDAEGDRASDGGRERDRQRLMEAKTERRREWEIKRCKMCMI